MLKSGNLNANTLFMELDRIGFELLYDRKEVFCDNMLDSPIDEWKLVPFILFEPQHVIQRKSGDLALGRTLGKKIHWCLLHSDRGLAYVSYVGTKDLA